MSGTPPIDSLVDLINKKGLQIGNMMLNSAGVDGTASQILYVDSAKKLAGTTVTASKPVYIDSNSVPQSAAMPFSVPVSGGTTTTSTFLSLTGNSTGSADLMMTYPLVLGSNVTTFTKTGFIKVTITDSAGNLTNGDHYIQIGTLS